jgi:hypothetical protein
MGAVQGQIKEQEVKCQEDFQCEVGEMPVFIKQLKAESERALFNSEVILGIREGVVLADPIPALAPAPAPAPAPVPVPAKAPAQSGLKQATKQFLAEVGDEGDEDGLP